MTFSLKLTNDRSKNIFSCRSLTLSALGLVGLLVATSSVAQLEPFKIGAVFAVTGPASFLGDVEAKAARLAVDL